MRIVVLGGTVLLGTKHLEDVHEAPPRNPGMLKPREDETEATAPAHGMPDPTAPEQFRMDAFYRTALAAQAGWD
ncbi:hypothetical protein [Actinomadura geliboluensis]|uniref:hypothetical protein n=1 Tax=Actinomadura geliboluensis TaxID=882440 RepID=UPI003718651A